MIGKNSIGDPTVDVSPKEEQLLKQIFSMTREGKLPDARVITNQNPSEPWLLDDLESKGLVVRPIGKLTCLSIQGLRYLNAPEAHQELEHAKQVFDELRDGFLKHPGETRNVSDISNELGLPSNTVSRVLAPLSTITNGNSSWSDAKILSFQPGEEILYQDPFGERSAALSFDPLGEATLVLSNFRGIQGAVWSLGEVNLLAGANGSGKSTLLEALSFFRHYYQHNLQGALQILGGPSGLRYKLAPAQETIRFILEVDTISWEIELAVEDGGVDPNPGEVLRLGDEILFRRALFSKDWFLRGRKSRLDAGQCCLRMLYGREHPEAEAISAFVTFIKGIQYYRSYNLQGIREQPEVPNGEAQLNASGQNLYGVLRNWQGAPRRFDDRFEWVMHHLRRAFPSVIDHIEFDSLNNQVLARFFPSGSTRSDHSLPLQKASDGMLVGLLHLTVLAGSRDGSIIAFDEMENQLHPHAIRTILAAARQLAEDRSLRIVLATHSTVLMNEFKQHPEQFFVTEKGKEGSFPSPLNELHDPDWLAHFSLGDLYERLEFGSPKKDR